MKIGILTYWWSFDNYGQLLQCYALQKYLRNMGHDAFLIRYKWESDIKKNPIWIRCFKALNPVLLMRFILGKKHIADVKAEQLKNNRHFDDFRRKYIIQFEKSYLSYSNLKNEPPEADVYIVGSDQVWNYWGISLKKFRNCLNAHFLSFGNDKTKRISYAASWGVTKIPADFRFAIRPMLARFDYVSVREETGVELCRDCGRNDAEWVCDPTLLLNADTYREIYKNNEIRRMGKKYILLYMLGNKHNFDIQNVYDLAIQKELQVIYVTGNGVIDKHEKYFATIPEWLYLVDNAEYVITNSFHCAVFSTIFHKQFGVVSLTGEDIGMNSRFESLFELRGTGKRYLSDTDFSVLDKTYELKPVLPSKKFLEALNK